VDFELSADQKLFMTSLEAMLEPFRSPPGGAHNYVEYSAALQNELKASGFLEIASQPDFGLLEAALLVEEVASCPVSAEVAASAMIAPLIDRAEPPIAIGWALGRPARYLNHARVVCLIQVDGVLVGRPAPGDCKPIESVVAYPLAVLTAVPQDAVLYTLDAAAAIRRRALIGIAAEAAGLMRAALDQTVRYVKDRQQFGQPLGHFQAIQHRLAEDAQLVHACRTMALRAAYEDDDEHAALACLYAQEAIRKIIYDCHQFSGAMGLTLEYPLHLWTYRLKYLQGEAGGRAEQAQRVARSVWPHSRSRGSRPAAVASCAAAIGESDKGFLVSNSG
jgi:hypothetical protein